MFCRFAYPKGGVADGVFASGTWTHLELGRLWGRQAMEDKDNILKKLQVGGSKKKGVIH